MSTYSVKAKCMNCGFKGTVYIPLGNPVKAKRCPKCGCQWLEPRS